MKQSFNQGYVFSQYSTWTYT